MPITAVYAQFNQQGSNRAMSMQGKHSVAFHGGFWSTGSQSSTSSNTDSEPGGFVVAISHGFWLTDTWAVGPHISVLDTGVQAGENANGSSSKTTYATIILFGVSYSFEPRNIYATHRFFLSLGMGPYMSSTTATGDNDTAQAESITAFGVKTMAGFNWLLSNRLYFNFGFGYHVVSKFQQPIGNLDNFSGIEFSMGMGLILGRGV